VFIKFQKMPFLINMYFIILHYIFSVMFRLCLNHQQGIQGIIQYILYDYTLALKSATPLSLQVHVIVILDTDWPV
jgi:hypothetical protein